MEHRRDGVVADAGSRVLRVERLGRRDYAEVLALQEGVRAAVIAGAPDCLLLVEHPPVITLGRRGDERHILVREVPVVRVSRGGDVTYHGPGQLVGYPIVDLARHGADVHRYLRDLEAVLIAASACFGVCAGRLPGLTGVWIGTDALAAIGVGIRRWVTMHGFALNVADLRAPFAAIVPCGLAGTGVTSLEQAAGCRPAMTDVEAAIIEAFSAIFSYDDLAELSAGRDHDAHA
jgi:lipoyl(octanoyl) transferase